MARKKKSRKKAKPAKSSGVAADESAAAGDEAEGSANSEPAAEKETPDEKASAKKTPPRKTPKKKGAGKKPGRKKRTGGAADSPEDKGAGKPASTPSSEPAEDPDPAGAVVDLDGDGAGDGAGDAASLVVDVAVLDDDLDGREDVGALIAATVEGASPEDLEALGDDPPVEPLDDEPPVETLDVEADTGGPAPYPEAADAAMEAADQTAAPGTEADAAEVAGDEPAPSGPEDLDGAIDLGPVSTPEFRDRLLAQALAHAEIQDARYRVPFTDPRRTGRWKGAAAAVLLLFAGALAIAPPAWVRPEPAAQMDAAAHARSIRRGLLLQAQQIDAYRVRSQRLPESLEELPDRLPGVRYVRSGNRAFQLIAYEPDGNAVVFDSSSPAPEFARLAPEWMAWTSP